MTQYKEISDYRGYTEHWYRNDNDFTYNFTEYERDENNGRCYRLVLSENLHDPNMDGALVRRRISKAEYESLLESCKAVCEIKEEAEEGNGSDSEQREETKERETTLKENIRRYKIMETHMEFTRCGMYIEALLIMELLRNGQVKLGISESEWNVEYVLEEIGCPVSYGQNHWTATFRL